MKSLSPQKLVKPVMDALRVLGNSGRNQEIADKVIENESISDEVANEFIGGKYKVTKLNAYLNTARIYLKHSGFIENTAPSVWAIVPGKASEKIDPSKIEGKYVRHRQEVRSKVTANAPTSAENEADEELESQANAWRTELLEVLTTLNPDAFERLVLGLLRVNGFVELEHTGKPGDQGIDGLGAFKINGLFSFNFALQCKRYKTDHRVSPGEIQGFRGAIPHHIEKGLFVTTASFTAGARKEASALGHKRIDLIDGDELVDKLKSARLGMKVETVERVVIDHEWYKNN